jgi:hypothetical protein
MTTLTPKVLGLISKLHALLGSSNRQEAESAREMLLKLLAENGLSWNDLPAILRADGPDEFSTGANSSNGSPSPDAPAHSNGGAVPNVLSLVLALIEDHVAVSVEARIAIALWVLHTYVFDRFSVTPRLALLSPVWGCGKTTLLRLLKLLVDSGERIDNVTAAAIYHYLHHRPRVVFLLDEGDNLDLKHNATLRSILNSGHTRGGTVMRTVGGRSRPFPTFAPIAVAAIGALPSPLLDRAVVINMSRASGPIEPLEEADPAFAATREAIRKWNATCVLAQNPEMPPALRNRVADNWRVLLAIADSLGYGDQARSAAVTLCTNRLEEAPAIRLLMDIRMVFQLRGGDRITSANLVNELIQLDNAFWHDWCGPNDDRPPRNLSPGELSQMLRRFHIRPKTIWPIPRRQTDRSSRGYYRSDFESAWRSYCDSTEGPTSRSHLGLLRA